MAPSSPADRRAHRSLRAGQVRRRRTRHDGGRSLVGQDQSEIRRRPISRSSSPGCATISRVSRRWWSRRICSLEPRPEHRVRIRVVSTHALGTRSSPATCSSGRRPSRARRASSPTTSSCTRRIFKLTHAAWGLRSTTAVALSFAQKLVVIAGTEYAGEIKKSIFTVMNYILPGKSILPMHCSANLGDDGDSRRCSSASRGPARRPCRPIRERQLIGDDEHAWTPTKASSISRAAVTPRSSICSKDAEPEIWNADAPLRHRARERRHADADGTARPRPTTALTENTRACYPLDVHRQRQDMTGPARRRATSSCSRPMRSASCRRSPS